MLLRNDLLIEEEAAAGATAEESLLPAAEDPAAAGAELHEPEEICESVVWAALLEAAASVISTRDISHAFDMGKTSSSRATLNSVLLVCRNCRFSGRGKPETARGLPGDYW